MHSIQLSTLKPLVPPLKLQYVLECILEGSSVWSQACVAKNICVHTHRLCSVVARHFWCPRAQQWVTLRVTAAKHVLVSIQCPDDGFMTSRLKQVLREHRENTLLLGVSLSHAVFVCFINCLINASGLSDVLYTWLELFGFTRGQG